MARKKSEGNDRETLVSELNSIVGELDEESIKFLKQQAEIMRRNIAFEEARRRTLEAFEAMRKRKQAGASGSAGGEAPSEEAGDDAAARDEEAAETTRVERGRTERAGGEQAGIRIEKTGEQSFHIRIGRRRVFFNRDELRALTRICHAVGEPAAGAARMYRWLERERRDFLNDTGIATPRDPALQALWEVIVTTYTAGA